MARQFVKLDLSPLRRWMGSIISRPVSPELGKAWAKIYYSFALRRFNKYGRGGGDWQQLAPSTLEQRKKPNTRRGHVSGVGVTQGTILRDTGSMAQGLEFKSGAAWSDRHRRGIKVGFGGNRMHGSGKITVRELARIHHFGSPARRIPARPIIVQPDQKTFDILRRAAKLDMIKRGEKIGGRA